MIYLLRTFFAGLIAAALIASGSNSPANAEEVPPTEPTATVTSDPPASTPTDSNPPPEETPPPTDRCTNLDGTQATMPAGYEDPDGDKVCTKIPPPPPTPTDRCTNLDGTQATMPAGYEDPDGDKVCTKVPPPPAPKPTPKPPASTKTWSGLLMLGHRCSGKGTTVLGGRVVNENTPAACYQAYRRGADGGEWDLQPCNRSFHDSTLNRMTHSSGSVANCSRTYRAHLNRTGARIPSGASMLSHTYGHYSEMNPKERTPRSMVAAHIRYANKVMNLRKLIVTSSELSTLKTANATSKAVHTDLLSYSAGGNCMSVARAASRSYVDGILIHYRTATSQCVNYMHRMGKTIRVWAVTTSGQFSYLKRMRVDGMVTDSMGLVGRE